jgi:hypothetical protein
MKQEYRANEENKDKEIKKVCKISMGIEANLK